MLGWFLLLGVICVSTGALFARMTTTDPLTTAAYRMTFAWILISPFGIRKLSREWSSIPSRSFLLIGIAGGFLALHFATWIHSLDHTSVANSVCLVTTSSLWTGLLALVFLRKKPTSPVFWLSCLVGILGVSILTGYKTGESGINWGGDGMALMGAVCMAIYLLLAQGIKHQISFPSFLLICYGSAMIFLWFIIWMVQSNPSPVESSDWIYLIALAIISQVMGHGLYNWCVRWMDARMVALSLLGEPIGATFLAWVFLHEFIDLQQFLGMAILLIALSLPYFKHLQSTKTSSP